jgi:bifunctional DNA-binding transcriptional regulator/antitoxin component of YhaV-PrlF toxin-antitoxin module
VPGPHEASGSYNGSPTGYNAWVATHVMKVSRNGQVSIPANARARWQADRVVVVDLGDRVVIRPLTDDPVGDLIGKYAGRGPSSEQAKHAARADDVQHERRKRR